MTRKAPLSLLLALSPFALAEEAGRMQIELIDDPYIETIVVTAQRRETLLQDTPVAMTVLGLDDIEDRGIYDIAAVSGLAPNAIVQRQPGSNANASIAIRGVGSGDTSLLVDPKVSYYLDGVYMSKTVGAAFDILDIERIEVLRGPQGTLFGRNSTGGAVNVVTLAPTGEWRVRGQTGVGNDRLHRHVLSVETPLAFDMLSTKFSGMYKGGGHWASNDWNECQGNPDTCRNASVPNQDFARPDWNVANRLGGDRNISLRAAARLKPDAGRWAVHYAYDMTDNDGAAAPFQVLQVDPSLAELGLPYSAMCQGEQLRDVCKNAGMGTDGGWSQPGRDRQFTLDHISKETLNVGGHTLSAQWFVSNTLEVKYIFGRRSTEQGYEGVDLDGGAYFAAGKIDPDPLFPIGAGYQDRSRPGFHGALPGNSVDMTTHELQAFGDLFDEQVRYTLGAHLYREKVFQSNPQTLSIPSREVNYLQRLSSLLPTVRFPANYIGAASIPASPEGPFTGRDGSPPGDAGYLDFAYGQAAKAQALYAQFTWDVTDRLSLTVGGRQTWDQKRAWLISEALCAGTYLAEIPESDATIEFLGGKRTPRVRDLINRAAQCWQGINVIGDAPAPSDGRLWGPRADTDPFLNANADYQPPQQGGYAKWSNFSYLLNASYALSDHQNLYVTHATGYNAGGFNARAGTHSEFATPVDQETLAGQEIGWKSELFNRRLRLNAALFRSTYKDMQLTQFDASAAGASLRLINAGTARMHGMEIDALAILTENLSVDFTYGLLSAKFKSYRDYEVPQGDQTFEDLPGCENVKPGTGTTPDGEDENAPHYFNRIAAGCTAKMPLAPKHTANLGILYERPVPWGLLATRVDAQVSSRVVFHPFRHQYDYGKGRTRLNASVSLRDVPVLQGTMRVTLWGKNLSNADPVEWGIDFGALGYAGGTFAPPRSFGLDLIYEFNR